MVISGALTAMLLYFASRFLTEKRHKSQVLKFSALLTVIIHISDLWFDFFKNGGEASVGSIHILPMYPCNIVMWMLLIAAFIENKESKLFRLLGEFCFVVGTLCGVIGILLNENFDSNPTLTDYYILKGLLSHSTMIFGCLYLYVGGYVKPRISSTFSLFFGFGIFVICGLFVNLLYGAFGMESPDGIWLNGVPYLGVSSVILGFFVVVIYFAIFALSELRLPKDERWYSRIRQHFQKNT